MHALIPLVVTTALAALHVSSVKDRNALTLPAQRHLVRVETGDGRPAAWLLAVQMSGDGGRGLELLRSDDDAQTWRPYAPIQPDFTHQDRADLHVIGRDLVMVWSFEDPIVTGSSRHDVSFQRWRFDEVTADWRPDPAVPVFDARSDDVAYIRGELARDSLGRIWVQAWRLERNGRYTAVLSVSEDEGRTFVEQKPLDSLPERGGGRIIATGGLLVVLYDMHHDSSRPARMRVRRDGWPLAAWAPAEDAFPGGIYHGAALSAVDDGAGGMHLVYKEKLGSLMYRHFDGARFGPAELLEAQTDWAVQPAATRVGETLYVFYNRPRSGGRYEVLARTRTDGRFSEAKVIEQGSSSFKGYPAAAELLPESVTRVPCLFGMVDRSGDARSVLQVELPHRPPAPMVALGPGEHEPRPSLAVEGYRELEPAAEVDEPLSDAAVPPDPAAGCGCGGAGVAALVGWVLVGQLAGVRRKKARNRSPAPGG